MEVYVAPQGIFHQKTFCILIIASPIHNPVGMLHIPWPFNHLRVMEFVPSNHLPRDSKGTARSQANLSIPQGLQPGKHAHSKWICTCHGVEVSLRVLNTPAEKHEPATLSIDGKAFFSQFLDFTPQ